MTTEMAVATIAAIPPTLAAALAFASSRSVKRSVGATNGIPLSRVVEAIETKVDGLVDSQANLRERIAHLEGQLSVSNRGASHES